MHTPPDDTPAIILEALARLEGGHDLDEHAAERVVAELMLGTVPDGAVRQLFVLLRDKGEVASEIAGAARALRASMHRVNVRDLTGLVDTCGTGGGAVQTNNISTAAAFVVAGAGVRVAKHGNRSFSSRSGSADVLEVLGVDIALGPDRAQAVLAETGIVFLFAPTYHPAMRHVGAVRRELGGATLMNLVGPLANPAGARRQVVGVAERRRGEAMARALALLGCERAFVVHGDAGLDEVSPVGLTRVWEVVQRDVREWTIDAREFDAAADNFDGLRGGDPVENAVAIRALVERPTMANPALRGAVLLNAAAALMVSRDDMTFGTAMNEAVESLHSGAAALKLAALRAAAPISTSG